MLEMVVGSLSLFLGWLCFDHVSRVRALYSTERSPRSRFYGEKPPMIFPSALGVLFVLDGLALLALTAYGRLHVADGLENSVGLETVSILALVCLTTVALMRTATGSRRNKQKAERQKSGSGKGADLFLAGK
jgi:hypothetical protein